MRLAKVDSAADSERLCLLAAALLSLKAALDPTNVALGSWVFGSNPCDGWRGISCDRNAAITML
jgi:hypothetical protein